MLGRRNPVVRALIANPKRNAGKHKPKGQKHMKYRENMSAEEIAQFNKEWQALDDAYASAYEHDVKVQAQCPTPDEYENPSDYVGMGWVDSRGRP